MVEDQDTFDAADAEQETTEEPESEHDGDHESSHDDHGHESSHDADGHGDDHGGHGHGADRPAYDPESVSLPEQSPPLRSTAPQSDFTMSQVATGTVIMVVGVLIAFGLPLALI